MRTLRCHCLLATARFRCLRRAACGLVKHLLRPPPPALGHPGNGKPPLSLLVITGVDAKDLAEGEIMLGSLDDPDLIAGAHLTLDDYAQVRPGAHRLAEAA